MELSLFLQASIISAIMLILSAPFFMFTSLPEVDVKEKIRGKIYDIKTEIGTLIQDIKTTGKETFYDAFYILNDYNERIFDKTYDKIETLKDDLFKFVHEHNLHSIVSNINDILATYEDEDLKIKELRRQGRNEEFIQGVNQLMKEGRNFSDAVESMEGQEEYERINKVEININDMKEIFGKRLIAFLSEVEVLDLHMLTAYVEGVIQINYTTPDELLEGIRDYLDDFGLAEDLEQYACDMIETKKILL